MLLMAVSGNFEVVRGDEEDCLEGLVECRVDCSGSIGGGGIVSDIVD